jgi:DNA-binding NtrC family response regulator
MMGTLCFAHPTGAFSEKEQSRMGKAKRAHHPVLFSLKIAGML